MKLNVINQIAPLSDVKVPVHRIFAVDVSGSMYSELQKLRAHLKNKLPTLIAPEDTMSLIWFSGRGQFGTIFENVQISSVKDLAAINTAIDRYLTAQGLTGFVDPLNEVKAIISRSTLDAHSLYFMTDGYDNQWSKKQILDICSELSDQLASSAFVEYGYYADHNTLVAMAEETSGSVVMAEDFAKFSSDFETTMRSGASKSRIVVDVPDISSTHQFAVGITDTSVVTAVPKNGQVSLPGSTKKVLYFSGTGALKTLDDRTASVAMVVALILRSQADDALDVASVIGDRDLFSRIENSFSKQDYSRVIDFANEILFGDRKLGKVEKLKISPNAYNVLTMLMDLAADEGNLLHLSHPDFSYTRGGAMRVVEEEDGKFVSKFSDSATDVKAPISALKFDSDRPNVSILVRREGTATLPPNDHGFGESVDTFIWRSYSIVRDGIVNVKKLPVVLIKKTYDVLASHGVIDEPFKVGKTYVIDVTKYPVINRKMASPISSEAMFKKQFELYKLQAAQKFVKTYMEKPELSDVFVSKYGEEATAFLKQYGITPGGFAPPGGKTVKNDPYIAKVLEIKMSGLNTLSKEDDVTKALAAKKTLTPSQQVYADVMQEYAEAKSSPKMAAALFSQIKQELAAARDEIIRIKFGVVLGKKWFTDMSSYDDNTRELDFGLGKSIKCQVILSDEEV